MHEIEVKARVRDKEALLRALAERGVVLSEPVTEDDTLYALEVGDMDSYNRNANFLRLRVRGDGKIIFTLKYHHDRHGGRADSMPLEHETTVGSRDEIEHMLLLMGYHEAVRIRKSRQKGRLGKWEVCVDEVEGLGSFMEFEELAGPDQVTRAVAEMLAMYEELGIPKEDTYVDRYDIALLKKHWGV